MSAFSNMICDALPAEKESSYCLVEANVSVALFVEFVFFSRIQPPGFRSYSHTWSATYIAATLRGRLDGLERPSYDSL